MGYTSDSEFNLVKRVQITNELPSISLNNLLPSALQNPFWQFLMGKTKTIPGLSLSSSASIHPTKTVNGVVAPVYGPSLVPPTTSPMPTFYSMDVEGVTQPELDLFLHEPYRYLDNLYPDHPDYTQLLTQVEIDDSFVAIATLLGYSPDYKFSEKWAASLSAGSMEDLREELKWKIRDIRSIAYKRKFFGSHAGYKGLFSGLYTIGSVFPVSTYQLNDPTNPIQGKVFRAIDFYGDSDKHYTQTQKVMFSGIVEPGLSDIVYELPTLNEFDASSQVAQFPKGGVYLFSDIEDTSITTDEYTPYIRFDSSGFSIIENTTQGVRAVNIDNYIEPSVRSYTIYRTISDSSPGFAQLTPSGKIIGGFTLAPSDIVDFYPQVIPIGDFVTTSSLNTLFTLNGVVADSFLPPNTGVLTTEFAQIIQKVTGRLSFEFNEYLGSTINEVTASRGVLITFYEYVENSDGLAVSVDATIAIQGALQINPNIKNSATFMFGAIPAVNPVTGEDNYQKICIGDPIISVKTPVQRGFQLSFYNINGTTGAWSPMTSITGARLLDFNLGYLMTQSLDNLISGTIPDPFTPETFLDWKTRVATAFETAPLTISQVPFSGYFSSGTITLIDALNQNIANNFKPGTEIQSIVLGGTGVYIQTIQDNVIVLGGLQNELSAYPDGTYNFTAFVLGEFPNGKVPPFQFKSDFLSAFPNLINNAFVFLWAGQDWKTPSLDYVDGFKDLNLYDPRSLIHPLMTTDYLDRPYATVQYQRELFLDVGINRMLYHKNSLNLKSAGIYLCLMDLPWLDHLYTDLVNAQKASEVVSVGAQINLSTDNSGYSSIFPGQTFSDPNIQASFIVFPEIYAIDSIPASVKIGSGGFGSFSRSSLFVSSSDTVRPPMYGASHFDINQPIDGNILNRGMYASPKALIGGSSGGGGSTSNSSLEIPLFETLIGEYEFTKLTDPNSNSNTVRAITPTFQERTIDVTIPLPNEVNVADQHIYQDITYKTGSFTPFVSLGTWNLLIGTSGPIFPDDGTAINQYYSLSNSVEIDSIIYFAGDWIIWSGSAWTYKKWKPLGIYNVLSPPDLTTFNFSSVIEVPSGSNIPDMVAAGDTYYFIANGDVSGTPSGLPPGTEVNKYDWIIYSQEHGEVSPSWKATWAHQTDLFNIPINYTEVTLGAILQALVAMRANALDEFSTIFDLPHTLIAQGSGDFLIPLVLPAQGVDNHGTTFDLSSGPVLQEKDQLGNVSYVLTDASDIKHTLDFKEPKYFKNLLPLAGTISKIDDNSTTIIPASGVPFDISQVSLFDQVKTAQEVLFRNAYLPSEETLYTNQYTDLVGVMERVNPSDPAPTKLVPISSDPTRVDQFRTSLLTLLANSDGPPIVGDLINSAAYGYDRFYDGSFERVYFKNLLLVAAQIVYDGSDPSTLNTLLPLSTSTSDQHAFTLASQLLSSGDTIQQFMFQKGTIFTTATSDLPLTAPTIIDDYQGTYFLGNATGEFAILAGGVDPSQATPGVWVTGILASDESTAVTGLIYSEATLSWIVSTQAGRLYSVTSVAGSGTPTVNEILLTGSWTPGQAINSLGKSSVQTSGLWTTRVMLVGDGGQIMYFDYTEGSSSALVFNVYDLSSFLPPGAPGGFSWTSVSFTEVIFLNGKWTIAGNVPSSNAAILLTTDLITPPIFGVITDELGATNRQINALATDGINLVASGVTTDATKQLLTSTDGGATWTGSSIDAVNTTLTILGMVYSLGTWYYYGNTGTLYVFNPLTDTDPQSRTLATSGNIVSSAVFMGEIILIDTLSHSFFAGTSVTGGTEFVVGDHYAVNISSTRITLSESLITTDAFAPGELSKILLIAFNTIRPIDKEWSGIPLDKLQSFSDPVSGQFPIQFVLPVDSKTYANRIYLPRTNLSLTNPDSPFYIHQNGYPLPSENANLYKIDPTGALVGNQNSALQNIWLCDGLGNYIDNSFAELSVTDFDLVQQAGVITGVSNPRVLSYTPIYETYASWLESGADFQEIQGAVPAVHGGGDLNTVQIAEIHNLQTDDPPYLILTEGLTPSANPDQQAIRMTFLPQTPVAVPLVGIPHYEQETTSGNLGLAALVDNGQVFYQIPQYSGALVPAPVPSTGTNPGFESVHQTYSLAPQEDLQAQFQSNAGSPLVLQDSDTGRWYVTLDLLITGAFFPKNGVGGTGGGLGSYIGQDPSDPTLPWVTDPDAFMWLGSGHTTPIYVKNTRGDWVNLTTSTGTLVLDGSSDPIPIQAPLYLLYSEVLNNLGTVIGNVSITIPSNISISGVTNTATAVSVMLSTRLSSSSQVGDSVQLNLLTAASITLSPSNFKNSSLWAQVTKSQIVTFPPDRVSYENSTYPLDDPTLFTTGNFVNANQSPVYLADDQGNLIYAYPPGTTTSVPIVLVTEAFQPQQPVYLFNQDWFTTAFFDVQDTDSNPLWQYLQIQDIYENQQWSQLVKIYQKKKSSFKGIHVYSEVASDLAYVKSTLGYTINDTTPGVVSFPQAQAFDSINGELNVILTANRNITNAVSQVYGLRYFFNLPDVYTDASDIDTISILPASVDAKYMINTKRNTLDPKSQESATVSITEVGVFNKAGQMLAYGTFPPIIYNTTRHHLSFNLFIKEGQFTIPSTN